MSSFSVSARLFVLLGCIRFIRAVRVPSILTCEDDAIFGPEFPRFRRLVRSRMREHRIADLSQHRSVDDSSISRSPASPDAAASAGRDDPSQDPTLEATARQFGRAPYSVFPVLTDPEVIQHASELVEQFGSELYDITSEGRVQMSKDLNYVVDMGDMCGAHEQPNIFRKYLGVHYFANRGLDFHELHAARRTSPNRPRFCVLGFAFAAVAVAVDLFLKQEAAPHVRLYLHLAQHLMGDYLPFGFWEESGWPMSSYLLFRIIELHAKSETREQYPNLVRELRLLQVLPDVPQILQEVGYWKDSARFLEPGFLDFYRTAGTAPTADSVAEQRLTSSDRFSASVSALDVFDPVNGDFRTERAWRRYTGRLEDSRWDAYFLDDRKIRGDFQSVKSIWQLCVHTATAGESYTFLNRFVRKIRYFGNSVTMDFCRNYNLCPSARFGEFVGEEILERSQKGRDLVSASRAVDDSPYDYEAVGREVFSEGGRKLSFSAIESDFAQFLDNSDWEEAVNFRKSDAVLCTIPAYFCRLFKRYLAQKKLIIYLGLPLHQDVGRFDRVANLAEIMDLALRPGVTFLANNLYLAELVAWKTDGWMRPAVMRIHGLHTNSAYFPARQRRLSYSAGRSSGASEEVGEMIVVNGTTVGSGREEQYFFDNHLFDHDPLQSVLVSRVGTSGGLVECILSEFVKSNPSFPLQFHFLENFLARFAPKDVPQNRQIYIEKRLPYELFHQFRAAAFFPYDTSLMLFWELLSSAVPIFVPHRNSAILRWMWGQHTRDDLDAFNLHEDGAVGEDEEGSAGVGGGAAGRSSTALLGFRPCSVVPAGSALLLAVREEGRNAEAERAELDKRLVDRLPGARITVVKNRRDGSVAVGLDPVETLTIEPGQGFLACKDVCRRRGTTRESPTEPRCAAFRFEYSDQKCALFQERKRWQDSTAGHFAMSMLLRDFDLLEGRANTLKSQRFREHLWCRDEPHDAVAPKTAPGVHGSHRPPPPDDAEALLSDPGPTLSRVSLKLPPFHYSRPDGRPNPTFSPWTRMRPDDMMYWSTYADWSFYPGLVHFASIPDLMKKLLEVNLHALVSEMKVFNDRALVHSALRWGRLFGAGAT